ncbi:MAG: hypothetical protein IH621_17370 [Krumholzibacteria bacterium]|nr:hypothetical protein [Candidatus Krumholzibacteria bacterium]
MKRTLTILALLAAVVLLTGPAEAGLFQRGKKKDKAPERAKTWRYDRLPTMAFHKGELRAAGIGLWKIGELYLQLAPDCEMVGGDELQTGRTAVVMGPRVGGTIVAWRLEMQKAAPPRPARTLNAEIVWSESDPTVGEGSAPN